MTNYPEFNHDNVEAFLKGKYEWEDPDSTTIDICNHGVPTSWNNGHLNAWVDFSEIDAFMRLFHFMVDDGVTTIPVIMMQDCICITNFEEWFSDFTEEEFTDLFPDCD